MNTTSQKNAFGNLLAALLKQNGEEKLRIAFKLTEFNQMAQGDQYNEKQERHKTAEDTILIKLLWYQESKIEKHLIDAAFVYQIQEKNLDIAYLNKWSKKTKNNKTSERDCKHRP